MYTKTAMKKHYKHGGKREGAGPPLKYEHLGQKKPAKVYKIPGDITPLEIEQFIQEKLIEKYA